MFTKGQFLLKIPLTKDVNGLQRYAIIIEEMTSCTALTMHPGMKETFKTKYILSKYVHSDFCYDNFQFS